MSAATRLRRLDEFAQIVVFEAGEHVSYANCGLPYYLGGVIEDRDALLLQTPKSLSARFNLDVRVHHEVVSIDRETKTVLVRRLDTSEEFAQSYDELVLATGARVRHLEVPGIERAMTLRDVRDVDKLKAQLENLSSNTAVIIGGGFIGIELAENLVHAGLKVTVVNRGSTILSNFDPEIVELLQHRLAGEGVHLILDEQVAEITDTAVVLVDGRQLPAGLVVSATGVEPDVQLAQEAGLRLGETGGLWVDSQQRTSDPHIFAAGDAVEKFGELTGSQTLVPLANLANRHGRLIADVIAGLDVEAHASLGTSIIGAFGMVLAMTGLSETAAAKSGVDHQVIHLHPSSHANYYPGAKRISLKVLFEPKTGKLLGAQAAGEDGVDKRIDVISTAIRGGLTIEDLMDLELSYAPQFGSAKDAINQAGYVGDNVLSGTTQVAQWYQVDELLAQGYKLLDVRTPKEHAAGSIPLALNVSVDNLRENIDRLSGDKWLVHCQVGQRGHTAVQILRQHGIEAVNLDGGYATWRLGKDAINRVESK